MSVLIIMVLLVAVAVLIVRSRRAAHRRAGGGPAARAAARRVRWARRLEPVLEPFGWTPSINTVAWSVIVALLANHIEGAGGKTRLPARMYVGLAPENAVRLGAYMNDMAADVTDLIEEEAQRRGWVLAGPLQVTFGVDQAARSLSPTVRVGTWPLGYEPAGDPAPAPQPERGVPTPGPARAVDSEAATIARTRRAGFVLVNEKDGLRFPLLAGSTMLGRSRNADVRVDDPLVSRSHACLHLDGRGITVEDLGSVNGVRRNGQKVDGEVTVAPGDLIEVGSTLFRLEVADDATAARPGRGAAAAAGTAIPEY